MTDPGQRPHLVVIQRRGAEADDGYTKQPGAWAEYTRAWARIRYGTAAERREAASERASRTATFECEWTPKLEALKPTDRLVAFDTGWDITDAAVIGMRSEVHITAVANLEAEVAVELS